MCATDRPTGPVEVTARAWVEGMGFLMEVYMSSQEDMLGLAMREGKHGQGQHNAHRVIGHLETVTLPLPSARHSILTRSLPCSGLATSCWAASLGHGHPRSLLAQIVQST